MKKFSLLLLAVLLFAPTGLTAGRIDTLRIHSAQMNRDVDVVVVSPSQPRSPRRQRTIHAERRYPVVYLLHGHGDDAFAYIRHKPSLPHLADSLGLIFVTPTALDSWYLDSPVRADYRYETFMTTTLIDSIDARYPTLARREGRAICGLSMGGHGALFLAFRHPELYVACGSMSGGVDVRPFSRNWGLPGILGDPALNQKAWDENMVVNQIDRIKNGRLSIMIDVGDNDFFRSVNQTLHERLLGRGIGHVFLTRPGSHNWNYFAVALDYQLLFLLKAFRAAGV